MAFSRLVFTVLLVSVSCYANNVPVFMWGDQTTPIKTNPLTPIKDEKISLIMERVLSDDPYTLIFIEQTLSPEDFSSKDKGVSPLSYLAQQAKSGHFSYLSSVENPVEAIRSTVDPAKVKEIDLSDKELIASLPSDKYLFINLNDAEEGESRVDMLKRHNDFIKQTYESLKEERGNVVAVYTGLMPSWVVTDSHSRVRRQAASNETDDDDHILDGVRMYVRLIELREGDTPINLTGVPSSVSVINGTTQDTTVTYGTHSFVMNFRSQAGYWFFESVTFNQGAANEEVLYPTAAPLYALIGFSYRCAQTTVFHVNTNTSRTLTFNDLQIQPYFSPINETVQFGNTFDCVGFFSGPIWAGLMVTFILLAITFYGIMMMMDIKTMDRFDDPKGKTITINASE